MQTEQPVTAEPASRNELAPRSSRLRDVATGVLAFAVLAGLRWSVASRSAPRASAAGLTSGAAAMTPGHSLAAPSQRTWTPDQFVGTWELNEGIRRRIEMRPNGTASMHVHLDLLGRLFYGAQLTLELVWALDGELLTHTIVGGQPRDHVEKLIRDFGSGRSYRIVSASATELVLEEQDAAKTVYRWRAAR
jgi:hypothetical protein